MTGPAPASLAALGIDIGGTKVAGGVVAPDGTILATARRATPGGSVADTEDAIVAVAEELAAGHDGDLVGVGIGAAGWFDRTGDTVLFSPHLAWRHASLRKDLSARLQRPLWVGNDADAAAWAEYRYGAARGADLALMITLGTGIGGGVIIGGVPARGCMGMHGEIGHMITHADGRPCSCGQNGCWEMYAAASKLREASQGMSVREVMNNVRAGRMIDIWENYIHEVVIGLSSLMMIFAPEVIAIGGGLSNAGSIVIDTLRAEVEKTSAFNTFNPFTQIVSASFQNDAGILGAAALASMME